MAKKSGTGYRLPAVSTAIWTSPREDGPPNESYPVNQSFELEANFSAGLGEGGPNFLGRYAGGGAQKMSLRGLYPQGWSGESDGLNQFALEGWYAAQSAAHRAEWDGIPTTQEKYDLQMTVGKGGQFYTQYLPEGLGKLPEPVDTRPLPEIGAAVEVQNPRDSGVWVPDTVKGFSGQVIVFKKSGSRQKADRDKTWRVVGAVPVEPPKPTDPPKPPDPIKPPVVVPPVATRPVIPANVMTELDKVKKYNNPARRRAAIDNIVMPWLLTIADKP